MIARPLERGPDVGADGAASRAATLPRHKRVVWLSRRLDHDLNGRLDQIAVDVVQPSARIVRFDWRQTSTAARASFPPLGTVSIRDLIERQIKSAERPLRVNTSSREQPEAFIAETVATVNHPSQSRTSAHHQLRVDGRWKSVVAASRDRLAAFPPIGKNARPICVEHFASEVAPTSVTSSSAIRLRTPRSSLRSLGGASIRRCRSVGAG